MKPDECPQVGHRGVKSRIEKKRRERQRTGRRWETQYVTERGAALPGEHRH